ncbi:MAG TPA: pilus assembly protein TadG-related protein [Candidatus Binataceae bacterium]|nr:pilus assembly protein TadG-related protein [Candidatus Binataceae bacterium]
MRRNYRQSSAPGHIAIILALVLPMVVTAIALGVDFAVMYSNWTELQAAADASARAGAALIYAPQTVARNPQINALHYAEQHGIHDAKAPTPGHDVLDVNYPFTYLGNPAVQVTVTRQVQYAFGQAIGLKHATLSATSVAYARMPADTEIGAVSDGALCRLPRRPVSEAASTSRSDLTHPDTRCEVVLVK